MPQAGLHALVGYKCLRIVPYEHKIYPAILIGAMLPDLDIIAVAIGSLFYTISQSEVLFHRSFSHSFFTTVIIYLVFSFVSELKNNPSLKSIGKGLSIGILSHIILDTFFWFREIHFLWPLPISPFNLWNFWETPIWIKKIILIMEFFCFRWYAWFLIQQHIKKPGDQSWYIKYLNIWKKCETFVFIFFLILSVLDISFFLILFGIVYIVSLLMAIWSTYMSRNTFELKSL